MPFETLKVAVLAEDSQVLSDEDKTKIAEHLAEVLSNYGVGNAVAVLSIVEA